MSFGPKMDFGFDAKRCVRTVQFFRCMLMHPCPLHRRMLCKKMSVRHGCARHCWIMVRTVERPPSRSSYSRLAARKHMPVKGGRRTVERRPDARGPGSARPCTVHKVRVVVLHRRNRHNRRRRRRGLAPRTHGRRNRLVHRPRKRGLPKSHIAVHHPGTGKNCSGSVWNGLVPLRSVLKMPKTERGRNGRSMFQAMVEVIA